MTKKVSARPPLSLPDFERVFRTIHGVLLNEKCDPSKACLHFGIIGAAILNEHHRLPAKAVIGAAAYNIGTTSHDVLTFATPQSVGLRSSENAFHCWVEVKDWVIDFQAPLFREMLVSLGKPSNIPRNMFQKPLGEMQASLEQLSIPHSYWYEPNPELGHRLIEGLATKPANKDFLDICVKWYRPSPRKMHASIGIGNQHGQVNEVKLSPYTLSSAW